MLQVSSLYSLRFFKILLICTFWSLSGLQSLVHVHALTLWMTHRSLDTSSLHTSSTQAKRVDQVEIMLGRIWGLCVQWAGGARDVTSGNTQHKLTMGHNCAYMYVLMSRYMHALPSVCTITVPVWVNVEISLAWWSKTWLIGWISTLVHMLSNMSRCAWCE